MCSVSNSRCQQAFSFQHGEIGGDRAGKIETYGSVSSSTLRS
jgi:hypothetical protein